MIENNFVQQEDIKVPNFNKIKKDKELRLACAEFEGMFLQKMMQTMRKAQESLESGLIKKSNGEKIFTDMLDGEYVKLTAKLSNSGLGSTLYNHIKSTVAEYKDEGNNFHIGKDNTLSLRDLRK